MEKYSEKKEGRRRCLGSSGDGRRFVGFSFFYHGKSINLSEKGETGRRGREMLNPFIKTKDGGEGGVCVGIHSQRESERETRGGMGEERGRNGALLTRVRLQHHQSAPNLTLRSNRSDGRTECGRGGGRGGRGGGEGGE